MWKIYNFILILIGNAIFLVGWFVMDKPSGYIVAALGTFLALWRLVHLFRN